MRTPARLILVAFLSLGLMAGCATTEDTGKDDGTAAAEQAISDAKAANKEAAAAGYEWRDTGDIIKKAEEALAAGNTDEATRLANQALKQAQDAVAQGEAEKKKYMDSLSAADRAALAGSAGSLSQDSKQSGMAGKVTSYSVRGGDSLWSIARRYGTTVKARAWL